MAAVIGNIVQVIALSNISKSHGSRVLFENVSFQVNPDARMGIVGPNGAGKSTLIRIIQGIESADSGNVSIPKGTTIGVIEQDVAEWAMKMSEANEGTNPTPKDLLVYGHPVKAIEKEANELGLKLGENPDDEELLEALGRAHEQLEHFGAYDLEARSARILAGLGFDQEAISQPLRSLSGGQMMRVALGRLLLRKPDVLLLDEPTNHLDLESVGWLQEFLSNYDGAILLVSHDRDFLNAVCRQIVEVRDGEVTEYSGNFESYIQQRADRIEQQALAAKGQARKIAEIERFVERFRYKAKKARQVQSRVKMLDKIERIEDPKEDRKSMKLTFGEAPRAGRTVVELSEVAKSYDDHLVLQGVNLAFERGEKVALVGPNGAGKSTLLNMVVGALEPTKGERTLGHNVHVAHYTQHQVDSLDMNKTAIDEIAQVVDTAKVNPRDVLGTFLFSGEDAEKPIKVMSGGERARVALAKLIANPANLLCMDEPTNHLDIESRNVIEEALQDYPGTVVLITHDRHLIKTVADVIVHVDNKKARKYLGTYLEFTEKMGLDDLGRPIKKDDSAPPSSWKQNASKGKTSSDDTGASPKSQKELRKEAADKRARIQAATKEYRKEFDKIEEELMVQEEAVSGIEKQLADPEVYDDKQRLQELMMEHNLAKTKVENLSERWEELALLIEEAEANA